VGDAIPKSIPPEDWHYSPDDDWTTQRELADLLRVTPETASHWAAKGRLKIFEHGMIGARNRKYSRRLVQEYQQLKLEQARSKMRQTVEETQSVKD